MIFTTKLCPDIRKRGFGHVPAEPNSDLTSLNKIFETFVRLHVCQFDTTLFSNNFLNKFNGYVLATVTEYILKVFLGHFKSNWNTLQTAVSTQPDEHAFEFAYITGIAGCQQINDIFRQFYLCYFTFFFEDCYFCFQIRRLDICDQTPLETRTQTFFKIGYFSWKFIRSYHDLLLHVVERIKGMEKFFLRSNLA